MGGLEATRAIRKWEDDNPIPHAKLRPGTILNGRLPILACSASLPERERSTIVDAGLGESQSICEPRIAPLTFSLLQMAGF